jgi:putative spermidine/putrescine transport system substrate-binding protein
LYNGGAHSFTLAAQSQGHRTPFQLAAKDWPAAVQQLIALRRNALTFYTQPEESVDLFKKQGAALMFANYGSQQVELLKKAGLDVGYAIPQEGALAWLDCWVITPGAKNRPLAQAWIDYLLEPAPSAALVDRQGLANTTTRSPSRNARERLVWLEPVEDAVRRTLLWERIVSGDRATKVLAP